MEVIQILERFSDEVDRGMQEQIQSIGPFIKNIIYYHFGWVDEEFRPIQARSGKKIRPSLNLLVHEALTGTYSSALPLAVAIELIHNYSLIHDDIEDRDVERRGRPTVWKIWGEPIGINTGSTVYALAFRAADSIQTSPNKILKILNILAEASLRLAEGQHLDLNFENRTDITTAMYLDMISRKTAALIESSTYTGALLATDDFGIINAYKNFGFNLGFAFQIRDDYLNIWGETAKTGKTIYADIRKRKKTFPVVFTMENLEGVDKINFCHLFADTKKLMESSDVDYVLTMLEKTGAEQATRQTVENYVDDALEWLSKTNIKNQSQDQLETIARFLVGRDY